MEQFKISSTHHDVSRQETLAKIIRALIPAEFGQQCDRDYKFWNAEDPTLEVGEFYNCREEGFTYSLLNGKQDMVFCVYEHRNSDSIIINGCKRENMKSYGPYNGGSKWDYLYSFGYGEYSDCVEKLVEVMLQSYKGEFDDSVLKVVEE